jgi:hypothetical protein
MSSTNNPTSIITIITDSLSPRLEYVCNFIFKMQFKHEYRIITSASHEQLPANSICINYTVKHFYEKSIQIKPIGLFQENGILNQNDRLYQLTSKNYPFANKDEALGFDVFAAIFYTLSRYEECLPGARLNQYGIYHYKQSFLHELGFLQIPIVEVWLNELARLLLQYYPNCNLAKRQFTAEITYDIDTAYAYRGRTWYKNILLFAKDFFTLNFKNAKARLVALQQGVDPNDTYAHIRDKANEFGYQPTLFFLLGDSNQYNRNLSHNSKLLKQLIKNCSSWASIGLHPSYYSTEQPQLIAIEKNRLESILQKKVTHSRQHYLRYKQLETFSALAELFEVDYSMGYAETFGFRAGTSLPFYHFDLKNNAASNLLHIPCCIMEGTFAEDLNLKPTDALDIIKKQLETVRQYNGNFCMIWHNHTLSNVGFWQGWKDVHDELLPLIFPKK